MLQFSTEQLHIRLLQPGDEPAIAAYRSDPHVARYVPWGPPCTEADAARLIARMHGRHWDAPGEGGMILGVALASGGPLIGEAMIKHEDGDPRQGVIGYALAREHHGKGYGAELVRGLIDRFFADEPAHRMTAWCDARNTASIRLLEKAGMRCEGEFRQGVFCKGEWVDERVYAMLREEWRRV